MGFVALLTAFLIEQIRPFARPNALQQGLLRLARDWRRRFDAGRASHARVAWLLAVVLPMLLVGGVEHWLSGRSGLLTWAFHAVLLYVTMGFRQFSHGFTEFQIAASANDLAAARARLTEWFQARGQVIDASHMDMSRLCTLAIREGVLASHRHVFGVLAAYLLLPGVTGLVLVYLAQVLRDAWTDRPDDDPFHRMAVQADGWIQAIPSRLTALGFAVVGNFEEALFGWRQRGLLWADRSQGIVVESAAGALGVALGEPPQDLPAAQPSALQATVGLVWRAVVLWMSLLLLLSITGWLAGSPA